MKISKAIEILGSNGLCPEQTTWGDYLEAVKLGREALKCVKVLRIIPDKRLNLELPGEDPE